MEQKYETFSNSRKEMPFESKRALVTALSIAQIFQSFLDSNDCPNMSPEEQAHENADILGLILIVGGFPRDVLLNRKINDIDIVLNLRELCKIHSNHLNKYHCGTISENENSKCLFYRRYANKFLANTAAAAAASRAADDSATSTSGASAPQGRISSMARAALIPYPSSSNPANAGLAAAGHAAAPSGARNSLVRASEMVRLHECDYILNSKFWVEILQQSAVFDNRLSVKSLAKYGFVSAQVVNSVIYRNVDLDGQKLQIVDTYDTNLFASRELEVTDQSSRISRYHSKARQLSQSGLDIKNVDKVLDAEESKKNAGVGGSNSLAAAGAGTRESDEESDDSDVNERGSGRGGAHGRFHSMVLKASLPSAHGSQAPSQRPSPGPPDLDGDERGAVGYEIYEIPIFSGKLYKKLRLYDFSINTLIIPLSSVAKLGKLGAGAGAEEEKEVGDVKYLGRWMSIIEKGCDECDGVEDICKNRILRVPVRGKEEETIVAHPETYHFWRVIRWLIREPSFQIDENLLSLHKFNMDNNWLTPKYFKKYKNCNLFMKRMRITLEDECTSINDIRQMFSALNLFLFNKKFINVMNDSANEGFRIRDSLVQMIKQLKVDNFDGDVSVFDIINVFEEFNYPIYMNNYKLESLLNENKELKDKLRMMEKKYNELSESKVSLARNANNTIDQLRYYLLQYIKK